MTAASLNDTEKDGCSGGGGGAGGSGSSNPHRHLPPDTGKDARSKSYVPLALQEPEHVQFAEQQNETSRPTNETQSHPPPRSGIPPDEPPPRVSHENVPPGSYGVTSTL
jgi:hypothetical protein